MTRLKHYLITLDLGVTHLHGYVMTNDQRALLEVTNQMVEIAEQSTPRWLPIILQTELSTKGQPDRASVKLVRGILCRLSEEAKQALATAKEFHMSVFGIPKDHPDDKRLMELH